MTDADILAQFASLGNGINLLRQTQAAQGAILAKIAASQGTGTAPDLTAELAALAAIKAEEDAIAAQLKKDLAP